MFEVLVVTTTPHSLIFKFIIVTDTLHTLIADTVIIHNIILNTATQQSIMFKGL